MNQSLPSNMIRFETKTARSFGSHLVNSRSILVFVVLLLFFLNLFGIKQMNLFWWAMYFLTPFLSFYLFVNKKRPFILKTIFRKELIVISIFSCLGLISVIANNTSLVDGLYTIGLRLVPLLLLAAVFDNFVNRTGFPCNESTTISSSRQRNYLRYSITRSAWWKIRRDLIVEINSVQARRIRTAGIILLFLILAVGAYEHFVLKATGDYLWSLPKNAHRFGFLAVFGSLTLMITSQRKLFWIPVFCVTFYLIIMADCKLVLIAFVLSILICFYVNFNKNIILRGIVVCALALPFLFSGAIINKMPSIFRNEFKIITNLKYSQVISTLDTPIPFSAEIFKGYIQLPFRVFQSPFEFLLGVGPGNYSTNIALRKQKEYARKFVLVYQKYNIEKGLGVGTFGTRANMMISIIAEFGIIGTIIYFYVAVMLILFPLRYSRNRYYPEWSPSMRGIRIVYFCLAVYSLIEMPFYPFIEEPLCISSLCLTGVAVIVLSQNRKLPHTKEIYLTHTSAN